MKWLRLNPAFGTIRITFSLPWLSAAWSCWVMCFAVTMRIGMRAVAEATDHVIFGSGELTPLHEARMTAANAVAAGALRRVLPLCTELAGARYILDVHPMNRVLRDAYGALAHAGTGRIHLRSLAVAALGDSSGGFTLPDDPLDQVERFGVTAELP